MLTIAPDNVNVKPDNLISLQMHFCCKFWYIFIIQTLVYLRDRHELQVYASKLPPGSLGLRNAQDALRSSVSIL